MGEPESFSKKNAQKSYILREDKVGRIVPKGRFSSLKIAVAEKVANAESVYQALRGDLFKQLGADRQPDDPHVIAVTSIDHETRELEADTNVFSELTEEIANLLLPVASSNERYRIFTSRDSVDRALNIKMKENIIVKARGQKEQNGIIKYKGLLPKKKGTYFGIQLEEPSGTCDGSVDGIRLFQCPKNYGMFVSLDQIIFSDNESKNKTENEFKNKYADVVKGGRKPSKRISLNNASAAKVTPSTRILRNQVDPSSVQSYGNLIIGMRAVAFADDSKGKEATFRGTIKYLGDLEDASGVHVGIELDTPESFGSGRYKGRQLFECKKNRGLILPATAVLSEEIFEGDNEDDSFQVIYQNGEMESLTQSRIRNADENKKKKARIALAETYQEANVRKETTVEDIIKEQQERMKQNEERKESVEIYETDGRSLRANKDNHYDNRVQNDTSFLSKGKDWERLSRKGYQKDTEELYSGIPSSDIDDNLQYSSETNNDRRRLQRKHSREAEDERVSSIGSDRGYKASTPPISMMENHFGEAQPSFQRSQSIGGESYSHNKFSGDIADMISNKGYSGNRYQSGDDSAPPPYNEVIDMKECEVMQRTPARAMKVADPTLQENSCVEVPINGKAHYGVIRWIGKIEKLGDLAIAGLELEEPIEAGTDGKFLDKRHFYCPGGRGFFIKLSSCKKDARFMSPHPATQDVVAAIFDPESVRVIQNTLPPDKISARYLGRQHGIQGHHNSCYMDSTLFAMFAFESVFDIVLQRKQRDTDIKNYTDVQDVLKHGIVNPLRKNGYVSAGRVLEFRKWLDKLGNVQGLMNEEKDPEEFLTLLFTEVLKTDPFIKFRTENGTDTAHFYQILVERDEQNPLPSVQYLLEQSFLSSKLRLEEVPSVLVIQMPRFGMQKIYKRVFINPILNITNILHSAVQTCLLCSDEARFTCKDCYGTFGWEIPIVNFCKDCSCRVHTHPKRVKHVIKSVECGSYSNSDLIQEDVYMELFSVVCIKTSHYVTFTKCGSGEDENWVFFDSMADRQGGENGYNIPEVVECPEVKEWLAGKPLTLAESDNKNTPERILRLFEDASLCLYRNNDMSMYK